MNRVAYSKIPCLTETCFNVAKLKHLYFVGRGQKDIQCFNMIGILYLIVFLPREATRDTLYSMLKVVLRYLAGDATLSQEIERNRKTTGGVCELARNTLEHLPETKRGREESEEEEDRALKIVRVEDQQTLTFHNDVRSSLKQLHDMFLKASFTDLQADNQFLKARITDLQAEVKKYNEQLEALQKEHKKIHADDMQKLRDDHQDVIRRLKEQHKADIIATQNRERGALITLNQVFKERSEGQIATDNELKWIGVRAKTMFHKRMNFYPEPGDIVSTTCNYRANKYYHRDWHLIELLVRKVLHKRATGGSDGINLDQLEDQNENSAEDDLEGIDLDLLENMA